MDKPQWTFENHRKSHRVFRMQSPLPYHTHPEFDSVFRCRTRPLHNVTSRFIKYGFGHIVELRSSSPMQPLLGPGLMYTPADPMRAWSRRMLLVSRSPMNT